MNTEQKFTALHRLLHWIMAILMTILFFTGFLRMYWMGRNAITAAIESQGIEVAQNQTRAIYRSLLTPMWEWHIIAFYILAAALLIRFGYMIFKGIKFPNPFKSGQPLKERLQGFTYIYFYVFVIAEAFTGFCLMQKIFPDWKEPIETFHKLGIYLFPIFIILHLGGIVLAELSSKKGITSKMIGGD